MFVRNSDAFSVLVKSDLANTQLGRFGECSNWPLFVVGLGHNKIVYSTSVTVSVPKWRCAEAEKRAGNKNSAFIKKSSRRHRILNREVNERHQTLLGVLVVLRGWEHFVANDASLVCEAAKTPP